MATLSMVDNKKLLTINEEQLSRHHYQLKPHQLQLPKQQQKQRAERASSLVLSHDLILNSYKKQQQPPSAIALLTVNGNGVERRHSSYCHLNVEKCQQQITKTIESCSLKGDGIPVGVAVSNSTFNYINNPSIATVTNIKQQTMIPVLRQTSQVNNKSLGRTATSATPAALTTLEIADGAEVGRIRTKATTKTNVNPLTQSTIPPPVPKRTFRGKLHSTAEPDVDAGGANLNSPNHLKQSTVNSSFLYPSAAPPPSRQQQQPTIQPLDIFCESTNSTAVNEELSVREDERGRGDDGGRVSCDNNLATSPFVDYKSHCLFMKSNDNNGGAVEIVSYHDAEVISDEEHMSLENSVFEESLNSTPVKLFNHNNNKLLNSSLASKTLSSEYNAGTAIKRPNLSSCSTIDSSVTSSGYVSHSERLTSTSTNTGFRSRFSSDDTQSSLDNGLSDTCRNKMPEINLNLNNNNSQATIKLNNNNINDIDNDAAPKILKKELPPVVPMRSMKLQPLNINKLSMNNVAEHNDPSDLTVSNSTSTSSAVSGGSTISTEASVSITETSHNRRSQTQEPSSSLPKRSRPLPPVPPARLQINLSDSLNNDERQQQSQNVLTIHNQLKQNHYPPIAQSRRDSNASSESFSYSPAVRQSESSRATTVEEMSKKLNSRQDSTISSDSFSQISSPGYNTKFNMEAPLLPKISMKRLRNAITSPIDIRQHFQNESNDESVTSVQLSALTKCSGGNGNGNGSAPTSLTIVRFQNGALNTTALPHQIMNRRKSSNPYITNGRLKFRLLQILINALALMVIAGCLAAYFNAYPTIKFVNKTIINTVRLEDPLSYGKNPAPGTCLPIIVKFCQGSHIPYNFTVFPNYIGHFGQLETQVDLEAYEALVDVRCYELVTLFLCTLFVPKCGSTGLTVPPCHSLCSETMRRCGFFFDVFGLSLPEYLNCKLFKDFESSEDCVGLEQYREVMHSSVNPKCDGFQCDHNRCLPSDYVCDGHLDCMDQADEASCELCSKDEIYCGYKRCIQSKHICDGIIDCPYGQDERNCMRLSDRNGDLGKGILEVYRVSTHEWTPACVKNWDRAVSPMAVCSMLGYSSVNATTVITQKTHRPLLTSVNVSGDIWKMYAKKRSNLIQELSSCELDEDYPIAELTCSNYECGKVKKIIKTNPTTRIIGGNKSHPGSWPFLAAILGGPEKVFYCAGVLISDQWVLTASHCIGNHTLIDLEDWTIQLGITRRNSFTYSGQKVKVKTVVPHPLYNTAIAHDNDIALFQLSSRVAFHEHLLPVCLPPPNLKQLRPDTLCTVIGWGKREDKNPKATYEYIVNEVQVPVIRRQQCDEWLNNLTVSEGMICAGYEEGGKDACQGDSGGPLLCTYPGEKDRWFVGGIVSWGIMCAHPKLPGVYANVIKYVPWILEQIQKHSKPLTTEDKLSKYDGHPGGPDILSNLAMLPLKKKKPHRNQNRSPQEMEYYGNGDNNE